MICQRRFSFTIAALIRHHYRHARPRHLHRAASNYNVALAYSLIQKRHTLSHIGDAQAMPTLRFYFLPPTATKLLNDSVGVIIHSRYERHANMSRARQMGDFAEAMGARFPCHRPPFIPRQPLQRCAMIYQAGR